MIVQENIEKIFEKISLNFLTILNKFWEILRKCFDVEVLGLIFR